MRSGNGRHRRPRQAPAFVVAAGVTGAGMALPLLATSGAHAADSPTWDRVADCESGGLWSANTGNGYYGGLQLTLESWKDNGGTEYASRPDLASRSEQIAVAEKILDALGPEAWPSCSMSSGLTDEATQAPEVDPGLPDGDLLDPPAGTPTGEPSPSGSGDTSAPEPGPSPSDSTEAPAPDEPSGSADDSRAATGGVGSGPSDTPDAPDATGSPAPSETTQAPDAPDATGTPGDDGSKAPEAGGRHRGTPDTRGEHRDRPSRGRHSRGGDPAGEHLVRPGDTLWDIAEDNHVDGGWPALYDANRDTVGDDPDLILPGQLLRW
jgi:hypothetical protein